MTIREHINELETIAGRWGDDVRVVSAINSDSTGKPIYVDPRKPIEPSGVPGAEWLPIRVVIV